MKGMLQCSRGRNSVEAVIKFIQSYNEARCQRAKRDIPRALQSVPPLPPRTASDLAGRRIVHIVLLRIRIQMVDLCARMVSFEAFVVLDTVVHEVERFAEVPYDVVYCRHVGAQDNTP